MDVVMKRKRQIQIRKHSSANKRRKVSTHSNLVDLYTGYEGTINGCWNDICSLVIRNLDIKDAMNLGLTCKDFSHVYQQWYKQTVGHVECFPTNHLLTLTDEQLFNLAGTKRMMFLLMMLDVQTKRCLALIRIQLAGVVYRDQKQLLSCYCKTISGSKYYIPHKITKSTGHVSFAYSEDFSECIKQHLAFNGKMADREVSFHLVKQKNVMEIKGILPIVHQHLKRYAIANMEHLLLSCAQMPIRVKKVM